MNKKNPRATLAGRYRSLGMACAAVVVAATLTAFTPTIANATGHSAQLGTPVPGASAVAISQPATGASSVDAPVPTSSLPSAVASDLQTDPGTPAAGAISTQSIAGATPSTVNGSWKKLGDSGISVAPATSATSAGDTVNAKSKPAASVSSVHAAILDQATAASHGLAGLVIQLARTDNISAAAPVAVQIPSGILAGLYGSDYQSRVRWVQLPATAAPGDSTQETAVASTTDATMNSVVVTPSVDTASVLLAPLATPVSTTGTGSFAATSLKPASSWDVSAQTGDFSWSYPVITPPAAAGPSPSVNLTYDSQSVDGETGSSNNQPSAIGDGWSLGGSGFIERTYVSCSEDNGASGPVTTSGDLCWKTDNATLSLGGHTGQLVKDASSGVWKLQSDDGSRIEHLVGTAAGCAANGTYDTDCWRLTTRDGTQYYFGLNELPGWASGKAATNSTWTVPVFGNDTGEPCHASTFATSACTQAWRWNLDYVVDTHNNAEALYYDAETNKYAKNGTTATTYTRGGQLDHIDYGMTSSTVYGTNAASDKIAFGYDQYGRCSDSSHGTCTTETITSPAVAAATPAAYPDVPFDQFCSGSSCPNLLSPTFWTTGMLDTINTKALVAGAYTNVDGYTLGHSFPAPGDGTNAALWLTNITHTGYSGSASLAEPPTVFTGTTMQNRVNVINGLAPLDKWRITSIQTSTGAVISVNYSAQQCTPANAAAIEASPQSNTSRCFPQWWTPQVTPPQAAAVDLFHKYVVTSVVSNPVTGGGNDQTQQTNYVYTGTPAWRYDTSPLTPDNQRTWSQYAGYNTVEIRVGAGGAAATQQVTDYTFYQGMDGDRASGTGGTKSVNVTGTSNVPDSRWFAGTVRDTKVLNGVAGTTLSETITTPWASAITANDNTITARLTGQTETVKTEPVSTGGNRTTDTTTTNDTTYGYPLTVNTTTSDAGSTCTTNSYAAANTSAWLIGLTDETSKVGVACANLGTAAYPAAAISDTKSVYDNLTFGAAATKGDVTSTQIVDKYNGTTASTADWVPASQTSYDSMGRVLSSKDILGHTTSTAYTPAANAAVGSGALTQTVTTNPLGWTTTTMYDPSRGSETSTTDQNGKLTTSTYDPLGRRTAVWLPAWPQSANSTSPSTAYTYTLSQTSPNAVKTSTITAGSYVDSYVLYDGLGQQIQTQTAAVGGGTDVTDTGYDTAGRINMTNNTYWTTSVDPSTTLFVPFSEQNVQSETLTNYDGANRPTATILNTNLVERFRTSFAYTGADRVDETPPAGGTPTSTYSNSLGQKTSLVQYLAATVNATATKETTTYTYDPSGHMTQMTDPSNNLWTWAFDTLGRQTTAVDPDTGTTISTYDLAGNTLTTTDGRNITLAYSYDALNRKIGQYTDAAGPTGSLLASWTYDTLAKGQLTSSTSYTGSTPGVNGLAYTDTITGYTDNYEPSGETISIPAGAPAFGGTSYTTGMVYQPDGAISQKTYPAIGGLAAERERFSYDSLGHQTAIGGLSSYGLTAFTALGQVSEISRSSTTSSYSDYGYDPGTGKTLTIDDSSLTNAVSTDQANRVYTRDNSSNITSDTTTSDTASTDTQCFTYDYLQNLTAVWTPTSNSCAAAPTSTTIGGAAPLWKTFTIDPATGNRTTIVGHATTGTGVDTSKTYTYPAAGTAHPHAVTKIATTASGTTTNVSYAYDASGDTTTRPGQTLTYTATGKIATDTVGTSVQTDVYDASGALLLQKDPSNGATLYLGDTQIRIANGATAQSVVRTYSLNGHPIAERTAAAGATTSVVYWLGTDINGTPDLEITAATGTVTHRYQDPYGNNRGTTVTWSSQNRYLDDPNSSLTGLTQIGARAYDPTLGRFLTVDSVLAPFDPSQNNGYDYSHNSPITFSDPSGNLPLGQYDNANGSSNAPNSPPPPPPGNSNPPAAGGGSGGVSAAKAEPSKGNGAANSTFPLLSQFRANGASHYVASPSSATPSECKSDELTCSIYEENDAEAWILGVFAQFGIVAAESGDGGPGAAGELATIDEDLVGSIGRYGPLEPGPLNDEMAASFRSSSYSEVVTSSPTILYRVTGPTGNPYGDYWSRTDPAGPLQATIDLALHPDFQNAATKVTVIQVPAGQTFYEGVAGPQDLSGLGGGQLLGGGNQVVIPGGVPSSWEVSR